MAKNKDKKDFLRSAIIYDDNIDDKLDNLKNWENIKSKDSSSFNCLKNKETGEEISYIKIADNVISTANCLPQDDEQTEYITLEEDVLTKLEKDLPDSTSFIISPSNEDKKRLNKKK